MAGAALAAQARGFARTLQARLDEAAEEMSSAAYLDLSGLAQSLHNTIADDIEAIDYPEFAGLAAELDDWVQAEHEAETAAGVVRNGGLAAPIARAC